MTSPFPAGPFFKVWKRSRLLREGRPLISAREAMFIDLPWGLALPDQPRRGQRFWALCLQTLTVARDLEPASS